MELVVFPLSLVNESIRIDIAPDAVGLIAYEFALVLVSSAIYPFSLAVR